MGSQPILLGLTHIERSIEIMREFEPPEGYYLAFSGGKDSEVLLELAKRSGVRFDAHYNVTGIDPPELVRFIRREFPEVESVRPSGQNWWRGLVTNGLPQRTQRWCCRALKETGGQHRTVLTGIRAEESKSRRERGVVSFCQRQSKHLVSPLFFWTEQQVWEFIRGEGLPYCQLYDEGWKRIGCVVCPFESPANTQRSMTRWPRLFEATRKQAERYYEKRRGDGKSGLDVRFATFGEWWEWWLARRLPWPGRLDEEPEQLSLFCPNGDGEDE
jgi:phosphoadenosine phosphosulfate reductase